MSVVRIEHGRDAPVNHLNAKHLPPAHHNPAAPLLPCSNQLPLILVSPYSSPGIQSDQLEPDFKFSMTLIATLMEVPTSGNQNL